MNIKSLWSLPIAAILLAACSNTPPIQPKPGDDDDGDGGSGGNTVLPTNPNEPPEVIAGVSSFLREKCTDCHGRGRTEGGINDILDVDALKAKGLIAAKADSSRLFQVISSEHQKNAFNPNTRKPVVLPNDQDIALVREWIDIGAPLLRGDRQALDIGRYLQLLRNDVNRVSQAEQNQIVYVDFHGVYNNLSFANAEMQAFANATLKLLNQLDVESTTAGTGGATVVLDENNLPIAIRFNPQNFNLDKQKDILDIAVRLSNRNDAENFFPCDIPAIPVLDFLHIMSSDDVFNPLGDLGTGELGTIESGYSNVVLKKLLVKAGLLNENQNVFDAVDEATFNAQGFTNVAGNDINVFDVLFAIDPVNFTREQLDISYNAGNSKDRFVRGCVNQSNVSAANRCIDRMSQSVPPNGSTWLSYDVLSVNNGAQNKDFFKALFIGPNNPPGDPLVRAEGGKNPFNIDGGEGIFQLKNRMLGFFVYDAQFRVLSNPPTSAVLNRENDERGNFISASACTYCHSSYTTPFTDAMSVVLDKLAGAAQGEEFGLATLLSQSQEEWDATFAVDAQDYVSALKKVYVAYDGNNTPIDSIWSLGKRYMSDLTTEALVAEIGFNSEQEFLDTIDNDNNLKRDIAVIFSGAISRENFTVNYQKLVNIAPVDKDFLRGCVLRNASDVGDFGTDNE
ncbi:MAG TPA: hypothetical protein VFS43_18675 [Polyangiaceae bacterium]|nr:hypothetical protein [Polyangiaceae bacterium]